jgi:hypothetical protein
MLNQASAAGTKRKPHGHLAATLSRSGQKQAGNIGAGNSKTNPKTTSRKLKKRKPVKTSLADLT